MKTVYLYYKKLANDVSKEFIERKEVYLKIKKPSLNSFHNILWNLLSFGKFRQYELIDSVTGDIVSHAQVMPYIFIFAFMHRKGIHIGPCYTNKAYRGKGYYPHLLNLIMADYSNRTNEFYIFCSENNIASVKGIQKAGFTQFATGAKNSLGMYVITEFL